MDIEKLWKNTQEELKIVMAPAVYQTFVAKTQLVVYQNNHAVIACPNTYLADINLKRYYATFKNALDNQSQSNNTLEFIIQDPISNSPLTSPPPPLLEYSAPKFNPNTGLHPRYTMENFIVGNSNNFAYAAAQAIIQNPGTAYNPFFVWGGVGVGKTHLIQAIGHELFKKYPSLKIKYFPAETFGNELVAALKAKNINPFKEKYRHLDCILVDDVQFLAGKEYIQEEFFHTFNTLHMNGKQVVLTSDRKPSEIGHLEDRLVSRFMGGLTVDIQPPDYEMRLAIIKQKIEEKHLTITPEAASYLAENLTSNIREIEGKIQKLIAQTLTLNKKVIDEVPQENFSTPLKNLSPRHLISICAKFFNFKTGDICGSSRRKDLVAARHITAYLLITELHLPLKEVGYLLGGRDHTSIIHARDKISYEFSTNPQMQQLINQIKNIL
ncbi:MAG TPA: chromosomal replication initiator protein DnaA [Candidatus Woesebacteria bacterium]|nr:chromosomal replication initiator protein DnaA [Candidatus Woesebacteria bacterium]HRT40066.1 chromosomal replication initiator protein DnaA [Candidatus Woesebacteria bacterium]